MEYTIDQHSYGIQDQHSYGIQDRWTQLWDTQLINTVMGYKIKQHNYGIPDRSSQLWDTQSMNTVMGYTINTVMGCRINSHGYTPDGLSSTDLSHLTGLSTATCTTQTHGKHRPVHSYLPNPSKTQACT